MATGLLEGGELSINGTPQKFDVAAGEGVFVNNYTDINNPTIKVVNWGPFAAQVVPNLATADNTWVGIDSTGAIVTQNVAWTLAQRRDIITLGQLKHESHTAIDSYISRPGMAFDVYLQAGDFFRSFGQFNVTGNVFGPNGANLKIDKTSGSTFRMGSNFMNDPRNPNVIANNPLAATNFRYVYRDGAGGFTHSAPTDVIDPDQYDDGVTPLTPVTVGDWTIQYIFFQFGQPMDTIELQYGQQQFASKDDAIAGLSLPVQFAPELEDYTFRGYLVVQKGCTQLNNLATAQFFPAGKFGMASAIVGAGTGEINTASNQGLSGIGLWLNKVGVDLQFKNINPASSKVTVTNNIPNKTVDIDVDPSQIPITGLSSGATPGQMLQADANGTPVDATNTNAQVAAAVLASHARQHAMDSLPDHSPGNPGSLIAAAQTTGNWGQIAPGTLGQVLTAQGPAVPPIWKNSGMTILQLLNARLATDQNAPVGAFGVMPTMVIPINTSAGSQLKIIFTAACSATSANRIMSFRPTVDGVPVTGVARGITSTGAGSPDSTAFTCIVTGLGAGAHTIRIEWQIASGVGGCHPVSAPNNEGASFMVEEIS